MKLLRIAYIAALAVSLPAQAEERSLVAPGNTLLTLSAEGKSTRVPDIAMFSSGVITHGRNAGDAMAANAAAMNRVIAELKRAGIADKDIQTSNLSLNPEYSNTPNQDHPKIIGYQANNTVSVRERNIADMGKVIDALVNAGANDINGPNFSLDNPDVAMDEARTAAIKAARARADLYARASGLKVIRILTISESGGYQPQPRPMLMMAKMAMDSAPSPVAAGEVGLNMTVNMQFELAP